MSTYLIKEYWQLDSNSPSGLSWIKPKANTPVKAGQPACTTLDAKGYYIGRIGGRNYKAHRVVFYLLYAYWPEQVDHIDGVRTNNNTHNLRDSDGYRNQHNRVCKGYSLEKRSGLYKAYISTGGKFKTLGRFASAEEARRAYLTAKALYHPTAPERCYAT